MWKIKDQEIREKIRSCVYLDCSNKSSWAGQALWKLRELTLQKLWTVISVCTSEHSGLVAGGQGSRKAKILFIWQQRHNSNAEKRQVRGICFTWSGLESLGSDNLSASASAVAGPTDASYWPGQALFFFLSAVQSVVLRLVQLCVSHCWTRGWRRH